MFYVTGIVVTFFLAAILISKRGKTEADFILAVWLLVVGLHLTSFYLLITRQNLSLPFLLGLELPLPLLHGPFLYLYCESVTNQVGTKRPRMLHFLPFVLSYLLISSFLISPVDHKIFVYENKGVGYETNKSILVWAIILSGIIYVILSLHILANHKRKLRDEFSYAEKINLAWLRYLIYGIGGIWIVIIFIGGDRAIFGAVVVFVIVLGYFGIKQVGIFTQQASVEKFAGQEAASSAEIPTETPRKTKYQKSSLNSEDAEIIHRMLTEAMREQKLFTNPELTLPELSKHLNVHPNNLSQVINTYEQKPFYDYVNFLRVEEFKRIVSLPENQKFNLLGLAHNCGFNSKTSFNRNFKNSTGLSPTEYLNQAHILLEQ
jgi:AraC-like DNA-binding protein